MVQDVAFSLLATSAIGLLLVVVRAITRPKICTSALIPLGFLQSWIVLLMPASTFLRIPDYWLLSTSSVVQIAAFVGLIKTWNSPKESSKANRAAWIATAFVAWGAWNALTDDYPLNENQARPSWYVYGWPICLGTSGRGRFPISDFSGSALAIDLLVWALLIIFTYTCIARQMRSYPQFSLRQWFSAVVGLSIALAISAGAHYRVLTLLTGSQLPFPNSSAIGGQITPLSQTSIIVAVPLFVGVFSVGVLAFDGLMTGAQWLKLGRTTQ